MRRVFISVTILILVIAFTYSIKANQNHEIQMLKKDLVSRDETINKLLEKANEIENLKIKVANTLQLTAPILSQLEKIDEEFYDGEFIIKLKNQSPNPAPKEFFQGYINLIDHVELKLRENK